MDEAKADGYDTNATTIIADIDSSEKFMRWRVQESMTLTHSRGRCGGWFLSSHNRRTCTEELMKFQGMVPENVGKYKDLPKTEINAAVGNAMSANVLERLLPAVLFASGLSQEVPDKWLDPAFIKNGGHFKNS